jgi:ribosomal protein S18 acetylase RimI-like enzyme
MVLGRYHITAYERSTAMDFVRKDKAMRIASIDDLPGLASLLAPGTDHADRLRKGNVCVWAAAPDGTAVGLQWVNVTGHPDRHFGDLSKPDETTAYLNQIVVDAGYRVRGYAPRVMLASVVAAGDAGFPRVRGLVARGNETMHALLQGLDFERTGAQQGVRLGSSITLRRALA